MDTLLTENRSMKDQFAETKVVTLAIEHITRDQRLELRQMNKNVVRDYAAMMRRGDRFPPLRIVVDKDGNYWLLDGFHRLAAAEQIGLQEVEIELVTGTFEDALWLAAGANIRHGLRRTHPDVKRAVVSALQHPRAASQSDRAIAAHVGVSPKTVGSWRRKLSGEENPRRTRTVYRGTLLRPFVSACERIQKVEPTATWRNLSTGQLAVVQNAYLQLHKILYGARTNPDLPPLLERPSATGGLQVRSRS